MVLAALQELVALGAIFADHNIWHSFNENLLVVAGAVAAIGAIYKSQWVLRAPKWVWRRLVSEPVGNWSREVIGGVVADKIDKSAIIFEQAAFQKRVDDSIVLQEDFRHEIKQDVMELKESHASTSTSIDNIHSCIDRRFTETQGQINRLNEFADRVLFESSGNRDRIRQMYDIQDKIVFETDATGSFTYLNPAFTKITGFDAEDALGAGWSFVIHPEDQKKVFEGWAEAKKGNDSFVIEFRIHSARDGGFLNALVVASPLKDGVGSVVGWVGSAEILLPELPPATMSDTPALPLPKDEPHA
jgi:PAS domain S-box-containing protein